MLNGKRQRIPYFEIKFINVTVVIMNSPKLNETKADKEPLGKMFWFLWLPWFVLLLLIVLIALYQKEGIVYQDDLGNTVFSKVKTITLFR